jgi:AcrR family transcriptional regulator
MSMRTPSADAAAPAGRDATARRWRRRSNARPDEILEAALAVFAERGFAAARMEDIAARAGVSKGTIYLYFADKESLFKALVEATATERLNEIFAAARDHTGSIADLLATLLRGITHFFATTDRVALPKVVIAESGNFPELARFHHDVVLRRVLDFVTGLIEEGQRRGEFRPMPAAHAARLVLAPIPFMLIWRTTFAQFEERPYDYAGLIECHIETLRRGFAPDDASVP